MVTNGHNIQLNKKAPKIVNVKNITKPSKQKIKRKKTSGIDVYSNEYLQKKHGIKIINPSSSNFKNKGSSQNKIRKKGSVSFGFFQLPYYNINSFNFFCRYLKF